ncbi:MAG TPA: GNAT family N-acetyltransferase [Myxococcales bacterium]|jgi:GNAT superfamily N-acetyltransferase|nr:GNAT family N-acetyltransferase [Myxococcales bacterium]
MLRLRPAVASDVPLLLRLIRELAAYEREPEAVVATEQSLLRDGFGSAPLFRATLAEWSGAPAGFALWFFNYSTWLGKPGLFLEDLFVLPELRGKGIGKALLCELAAVALREGCGRFQWQVLDWNEPSIRFYEGLGAKRMQQWLTMRVEGDEALRALAAAGAR